MPLTYFAVHLICTIRVHRPLSTTKDHSMASHIYFKSRFWIGQPYSFFTQKVGDIEGTTCRTLFLQVALFMHEKSNHFFDHTTQS